MPSGSAGQIRCSAVFLVVCINAIDNVRIKTILVPIESWDSGLSNGTRIISVRQYSKRFVSIDWIRFVQKPQLDFWKPESPNDFYHTGGKITIAFMQVTRFFIFNHGFYSAGYHSPNPFWGFQKVNTKKVDNFRRNAILVPIERPSS